MLMYVNWLVGPEGAVRPKKRLFAWPSDIARIYRDAPAEFRYAVGTSVGDHGELVVLDLYRTMLTQEAPFLVPHFVERFTDMDQAVASLVIGYDMGAHISLMRETKRNKLNNVILIGIGGKDESLQGLTPLIRRPRR